MKTTNIWQSGLIGGVLAVLVSIPVGAVPSLLRFKAGDPVRSADINSNFDTLRSAVSTLETTVSALQTDLATTKTQVSALSSSVDTLKNQVSAAANRCKSYVLSCTTNPCTLICPSGMHVEGGGCDAAGTATLLESMPATGGNFTDGEHPIGFFDRWNCEVSSGGSLNGAYAYCCNN